MRHLNLRSYVIGFVGSLALTLCAYFIVVYHVDSGHESISHGTLGLIIGSLALSQFFVQAYYFLHLGQEDKPHWNRLAFAFMTGVVLILVFGSLWIMSNLDYHHDSRRTPEQTDQYIIEDEGVQSSHNHQL